MFFDINMEVGKYNEFFVYLQPFPQHLSGDNDRKVHLFFVY